MMMLHNLGIVTVKYYLLAIALAAVVSVEPALAGSLSAPIMSPEVVSAETTASSPEKLDGLMVAIGYVIWMMVLGGAF